MRLVVGFDMDVSDFVVAISLLVKRKVTIVTLSRRT